MHDSRPRPADLERLAPILDTALDAVVVMSVAGLVVDWNRVAESIFGWPRHEAIGRPMAELIVPAEHREAHAQGVARFNATGEARILGQRLEITGLRRSGEEFPIELSINVTDAAGEPLFIGFLRDISARRRSERLLARQAREAGLLFRISQFAAESDSVEEVLQQTLRTICELTGWPVGHALLTRADAPNQLVPTDIWHDSGDVGFQRLRGATLPLDFRPGVGLPGQILRSGEPTWVLDTGEEQSFVRKHLGYASAFGFPIKSSGRIVAILEFFAHEKTPPDDELLLMVRTVGEQLGRVLERSRAIAELRDLNETLEQRVDQRTAELMQTQDQLRQAQKMEAIGQLTGGVAHDFNNLLTIIRSSVDLLQRKGVREDRRQRYLDAISDTADRAAKLTGQLLAFARRQVLKPELFDAAEHVRGVCDMIRTVIGARVSLQLTIDCPGCFVRADIAQFETALINIAVNARDAMDEEGALTIRAHPVTEVPGDAASTAVPGDHVAISLSDTGRGIPPELLDQIFEPFFTTKDVGKGTGLGLSQVYGFTKQSGGEVRVQSAIGQGTTFTLYLPRMPRPAHPAATAEPEPVDSAGQLRILVVEDNPDVGSVAHQLLCEIGHEARLASSGAAALRLLEKDHESFDLVFTDVVMPGMSGIELGDEIRRRWPALRVVLASGYSEVLAQQGEHAFPLLQKPYTLDALARALRSA